MMLGLRAFYLVKFLFILFIVKKKGFFWLGLFVNILGYYKAVIGGKLIARLN